MAVYSVKMVAGERAAVGYHWIEPAGDW